MIPEYCNDKDFIYDIQPERVCIKKYVGQGGCIVLPSFTPDGMGITTVGCDAFGSCEDIIKVSIPEGYDTIEAGAFWFCEKLNEVNLPNSLRSIGSHAFSGCESLKRISLPDSISQIGPGAFISCDQLEITLSNNIKTVNPYDFTGVKAIYVKKNHPTLVSIDGVVFSKDMSMLISYQGDSCKEQYNIPEEVKIINHRAFHRCKLKHIVLPKSLKIIKDDSFERCEQLVDIEIPEGTVSIGNRAFTECRNLAKVVLARTLSQIGECCFSGCGRAIFAVSKQSYAHQYCVINKFFYTIDNNATVYPVLQDDPQEFVRTKMNYLRTYLWYVVRCFDKLGCNWGIALAEYDTTTDDIGDKRDTVKGLRHFFNYIKRTTDDPFLNKNKFDYFIIAMNEMEAKVYSFSETGTQRYKEKYVDFYDRYYDSVLISVYNLWFVMALTSYD